MNRLKLLRQQIDRVDLQLLRLLSRRAALAVRIGRLKRTRGLRVFDGRREGEILQRLVQANRGPLPKAAVRRIFHEIVRQHRVLQAGR